MCAQVLAVGWGPDYNGALDSTNSIICTPLSCTSSQGGKQWYLGTNQNSGTVYFSDVDYSPLYCNGDKGCGWNLIKGNQSANQHRNADEIQKQSFLVPGWWRPEEVIGDRVR